MNDIDRKIDDLADEWGYLEITVRSDYDENPYRVRNHTDEGLCSDERVWADGNSLKEALDYALDGKAVSSYQEAQDAPWNTETDRGGDR